MSRRPPIAPPAEDVGHAPYYSYGGPQGPPRAGRVSQLRQFTTDKVPADQDGFPAQHAGIDPQIDPSSYRNIPASWVYTPLLGRRSAGVSFFHQATPNRTLVQFGPYEIYNFTSGVYFPEPCQFDRVIARDLDYNAGNKYTLKINGKQGARGGDSPFYMQIVGTVPEKGTAGVPMIEWYEMFNLQSRTSLTIVPKDARYSLEENMGPQGFVGRPFSTATALVVNNVLGDMELDDFVWSSTDQITREARIYVSHALWSACKEDMKLRSAATVAKMDEIHRDAYGVLNGGGRQQLMPRRVDVNDAPM